MTKICSNHFRVERIKCLFCAVIHHKRLTVFIHNLGVTEPALEGFRVSRRGLLKKFLPLLIPEETAQLGFIHGHRTGVGRKLPDAFPCLCLLVTCGLFAGQRLLQLIQGHGNRMPLAAVVIGVLQGRMLLIALRVEVSDAFPVNHGNGFHK